MMRKPSVIERAKQIREDIGDNKLIVSAGRVDYVKGAKEMLLCYERLLERRPEMQGKSQSHHDSGESRCRHASLQKLPRARLSSW